MSFLSALLILLKTDNPQNNSETDDEYVKGLQRTIRSIKENRELEREFMSWEDIRRDARLEGILEGRRKSVMDFLEELGIVPEDIKNRIMSETDEDILKLMSKAAFKATSFEEFRDKISDL
ncbi:MAG: hypothetical protein IKW30_00835 [Lachnospiraceae bacterium]|nr:hypothetical protein [Lachnospiraceae bacterium]